MLRTRTHAGGEQPRIEESEGDKSPKTLFHSNKTRTRTFHQGLRNSLLPKEKKSFVHRYIKITFMRSEHTMSNEKNLQSVMKAS